MSDQQVCNYLCDSYSGPGQEKLPSKQISTPDQLTRNKETRILVKDLQNDRKHDKKRASLKNLCRRLTLAGRRPAPFLRHNSC